jgi:hypothetical protein
MYQFVFEDADKGMETTLAMQAADMDWTILV